ncbi:diguanylate cyclase response regulator [Geothrix oryzae]|uniref:diguanylate cyclase n=1 Tax=Geothrix oryzae TaxID=2927975 RepID=A0ABM8DT80_9BACT|nr:diguanylate cyclase [Geothrix oryzae]BDU70239.1 diguanylate cyclase response regulator [Geothrix oryzae]
MGARILIVDDNTMIRSEIKAVLMKDGGFSHFMEAADGLTAFKTIMETPPDLVLCDLVMPGFDGLKFLGLKASRKELAQIPVIILTAEDDLDRKAEILERGASDYVTKPFHEKELLARVRIHTKLKLLQDELREMNVQLEALSVTDVLTGLANRRRLMTRLEEEVQRARRYKTPLSVVMIDIDHFKQVNDSYGHAMGDEVLRNIGAMLKASLRTTDLAARYGGEELTLVLPHTDIPAALQVAENLRQKFSEMDHTLDGVTIRKTASMGLAARNGQGEMPDAEDLLKHADEALYRAKQGGRNRVEVAE